MTRHVALALLVLATAGCAERREDRFAAERARLERLALDTLRRAGYAVHRHEEPEFAVAYPSALLAPTEPLPEGRGQRFASRDGAVVMEASVEPDADSLALARRFAQETGGTAGAAPLPARDLFVVTRRRDGRFRYVKATLRDGALSVLTFEYDTTRAAELAGVIPRVASTFPR